MARKNPCISKSRMDVITASGQRKRKSLHSYSCKHVITCMIFGMSFSLAAVFFIHSLIQGISYSSAENSAPFAVFLAVTAMQYLLPSLVLFFAGMVLQRRLKKVSKNEKN